MQSAKKLSVDGLTLYAPGEHPISPLTSFDSLTHDLNTGGTATLTLPPDGKVMTRDLTQQVFLVLQYSFVMA